MLHSWNWPSQGGQHGISSCCSEEQPWPPALGTLPTAPRASSNPPASPEDNTEELAELSCIQGWCFSLPRADVLRSKAAGQGSQGPQSGRWPQVLSATVQAWPEQQQLVAPALLNLHECDADEYERGDVAATAGAAAGAAPAPPCCPLLGRAHSLSPPAVLEQGLDQASKLLTLLWKPGFSPGVSRRVRGCLCHSAYPPPGPHGLGSATAARGDGALV